MKRISEAATLGGAVEGATGTYRVRLISEGQGSSGYYSAEMLNEYLPGALPIDTLVYLDHTDQKDVEERGGTRSFRDVAGRIVSTPAPTEDGKAMEAQVKFISAVRDDLDVLGESIGLSIEVHAAEIDDSGNVTEMAHHPLNSVALVPVPGRDGRVLEKLHESFRRASEGKESMELTPENIAAIAVAVVEALDAREAAKVEEQKNVAPETEVPTAIEMAAKFTAESLTTAQITAVMESVESGKDFDKAIADVKALVEEAKTEVETGGSLSENLKPDATNEDYYTTLMTQKNLK